MRCYFIRSILFIQIRQYIFHWSQTGHFRNFWFARPNMIDRSNLDLLSWFLWSHHQWCLYNFLILEKSTVIFKKFIHHLVIPLFCEIQKLFFSKSIFNIGHILCLINIVKEKWKFYSRWYKFSQIIINYLFDHFNIIVICSFQSFG